MNREEKNLQSRQKIMDAAFREFGEKSYPEASLNVICRDGEISKGIIYHYFKDKDALYLACAEECFGALTEYLREHVVAGEQAEAVLKQYFDARSEFFRERPEYLKVFYSAVITPPPHLKEEILGVRKEFDALNVSVLTEILNRVPLRKGMGVSEVIEIFGIFQDLVNTRYQMETIYEGNIEEYNQRCSHILEILLYGVIERG